MIQVVNLKDNMKRSFLKPLTVDKVFAWDWKKCLCCEKDYMLRFMWEREIGPYYGGIGKHIYVCNGCATNRGDIAEGILNTMIVIERNKIIKNLPQDNIPILTNVVRGG